MSVPRAPRASSVSSWPAVTCRTSDPLPRPAGAGQIRRVEQDHERALILPVRRVAQLADIRAWRGWRAR
jgi:hypothetical protein